MSLVKSVFYSPLSVVAIVVFLMALTVSLDLYFLIKTSLIIYLIGLAGTTLLGVPAYLILKKLNITNGIVYSLIGFISPLLICWIPMYYSQQSVLFLIGVVSSCFGALCAYVFWLNAVYKEPQ